MNRAVIIYIHIYQFINCVKRQLDDIRAMGVNVSMDDFGKGYSNLSFIRGLRLSAIKIDKNIC